ncbi:PREDICTED: uncharacterized protein LOC109487922 [Branchiostoma belcheri]|uniref:Uncharacterized protein LOC109487922 n=1 Tax=Branchiostoma belcheri TaxID=7741 RepID=A0A6P5AX00_BRABE|nr:PREDICTED: uncharacterized protein LOC109487922 [Branchiostoma belcheri]
MGSLLTSLFVLTLLSAAVGTTVDYTGRNLTHVPTDAITSRAHTVRLSHNRISRLGSGFTSAPRIRYLLIDDNRVNNLSPQTFQPLRELLVLDLDRNCVVSLRDFTFSALAALSDLILSNNLISAVSARAFHGLTSLQFLELSGNRLSAVPAQAVRLIPSERLLLVLLMVNNISQIPGDIASLHPSASFRFQGNPLRCPAEKLNSSRVDVINVENMSSWPAVWDYVVDTPLEGGRRFVRKSFFIKRLHKYFGVAPKTFYVPQHLSLRLPEVPAGRYVDYPTAWITPTGRRPVPVGKALTVEDFPAEDSGLYTYVRDVPGIARSVCFDLLICLRRPAEDEQEPEKITTSSADDFSPQDRKNSRNDICAGSQANQSCSCFNGSRSPSFHHPEFKCDAGSTNSDSEANPTLLQLVLGIASVVVVMMLFPVAVFRWRKGGRSRYRENGGTTGAALCAGAQAMAVCIPLHPLPGLTELSTEGGPSASPLTHLRRGTGLWAAMKMGAMQYSFHRAAGAPPADTIGTTEAQVHHYENADADEYASAAPPPLPGDGETAADAVNTSVPDGLSEQPAFQIGEGLEMPYGVAAANTLYRQRGGTAPNPSTSVLTNEHTSSADVADSATYSAAGDNPVEAQTVTTDLYLQQTAHILSGSRGKHTTVPTRYGTES